MELSLARGLSILSAFNGERLKKARLFRGLTIKDLADAIDVSKQAVSQYEKNSVPRPDKMMGIIRVLKFPKKYFYEEESDLQLGEIFYRSQASTSQKDKYRLDESIRFLGNIYKFFNEYIDFPKFDVLPKGDFKDVEELASKLREYWGIGNAPIKSMVNLLENKGFLTTTFQLDSLKIDAFSTTIYNDRGEIDRVIIVLGSDKPSAVRRNFDVAHELGHFYFDEGNVELSDLSRDEYRDMENKAHEFAGALLLPKNAFINDVSYDPLDIMTYYNIKKKWNVSISAMIVRSYKLKIINNREYQNLMKTINRRKWRINEPFDNEIVRAVPYVLPHAVDLLIEKDVFSKETLLQELSSKGITMYAEDIENLLHLKSGTLTDDKNYRKVVPLRIK